MRRVVVLDLAADDLERGRDFYNRLQHGVGDYFARSLMEDLERLALHHGIHSKHFGCFRMLARHFPFGIYYRETETQTQVIAVLDMRRDPNWIRAQVAWRGS